MITVFLKYILLFIYDFLSLLAQMTIFLPPEKSMYMEQYNNSINSIKQKELLIFDRILKFVCQYENVLIKFNLISNSCFIICCGKTNIWYALSAFKDSLHT